MSTPNNEYARLTCGCRSTVDDAENVYTEGFDPDRAYCPKHGDVWHIRSTPDQYTHAFKTYLGLPPAKGEAPVCGAVLTDAYDFPGVERPPCPDCQRLVSA